jgi:hypothetical protein
MNIEQKNRERRAQYRQLGERGAVHLILPETLFAEGKQTKEGTARDY